MPLKKSTPETRHGSSASAETSSRLPSSAAVRETIESIVIAFVLAFLFRTFEAEMFVIPTGSMAPTLMGRHKDLTCPKCGCPYQVGTSDEVDSDGASKGWQYRIASGTCPMCRYRADLSREREYPSYNGDRILVGKFFYELRDPDRWDVVVFKFPGDGTADARTNFIKRLIGLPGETIRIRNGDIWVRRGDEPFRIARKPPRKLLAVLQPVFDNDYMRRMAKEGWPARWTAESAGDWRSDDDVTFHTDGTATGPQWLRYHHRIPTASQWAELESHGTIAAESVAPQLIRDFTAYNASRVQGTNFAPRFDTFGRFWVGDLAVQCTVDLQSPKGELIFELRKGGRRFECRLDAATGRAELSISGSDMRKFRPTASTPFRGPGRHDVRFSNCDNELRLWIDGRVMAFDGPTAYENLGNTLPDAGDLSPVGIAAVGAQATLSHLAIFRDLYYISDMSVADPSRSIGEVSIAGGPGSEPANRTERPGPDYVLKPDQFFMLGDNSARSKDGRLWGPDNYWVPRELLIGKALFLYWPHSWDRLPYVNVPMPFFPNFSRMGFVR
ncbi:MAG: S26 family signal peptidase [Thermoguttaceae bacterium]